MSLACPALCSQYFPELADFRQVGSLGVRQLGSAELANFMRAGGRRHLDTAKLVDFRETGLGKLI